jgi:hypothetical protein
MQMLEIMWRTYDTVNGLIKFSDTKAGAILAINGAILAIVFSKVIEHREFIIENNVILITLILGFISGIISIFFCIISLYPSLDRGGSSLIYFGNIAINYNNYNTYKLDVTNAFRDEMDEMDQITEQVWVNSRIAWNKYVRVSWAIRFFLFLVIFFCIAGISALYFYQRYGIVDNIIVLIAYPYDQK